ncbi:MAG: DUF5702 domain-containing protein [Lachnospiraceae bacterium]|jgi:hypothetical protein|nr:DUF5702 domain-containing protein [Lachnospiraceae bacterium]
MKNHLNGYLTVFLALSLTMILGVFFFLIRGAFTGLSKMKLEIATDISVNAGLGEFHREMLEQYDLLYIDLSYGGAGGSVGNLENHLVGYIDENVRANGGVSSWNELQLQSLAVTEMLMPHHYEGKMLKRQACAYISANTKAEALTDMAGLAAQAEALDGDDQMAKWQAAMGKIAQILASLTHEKRQEAIDADPDADVSGVNVEIDNPAESVFNSAEGQIGSVTAGEGSKSVNLAEYYSHRAGGGAAPSGKYNTSFVNEAANALLFKEYIFEKMGYYSQLKEGSRLDYQLEYIIAGKNSDSANLQNVKNRIFAWRLADNVRLYFASPQKLKEATELATAICAAVTHPELIPAVTASLLFSWAFEESIEDVKKIMDGEKIPLVKQQIGSNEGGLYYNQYLEILLYLESEKKKLSRVMDIMEMDVRQTPGNQKFRIDWCVESFRVTAGYYDQYESYTIDRRYGYY